MVENAYKTTKHLTFKQKIIILAIPGYPYDMGCGDEEKNQIVNQSGPF